MSNYLRIHGAYVGGWAWEKVIPLLEQKGHKVNAPDLPGNGMDQTPLSEGRAGIKINLRRIMMIKVTVFYPNDEGKKFDMDYYCSKHIPLVQQKLGDALKNVYLLISVFGLVRCYSKQSRG